MNKNDQDNILHMAVKTYGKDAQIDIMIEEMAELTKALLKHRRYPTSELFKGEILEEMADVSIMLDQMKIIFGDCEIWREQKLMRQFNRMLEQKDDHKDRIKKIREAGR